MAKYGAVPRTTVQLWRHRGGRQWIGNVEPPELRQALLDVGQLPSWQTGWPPARPQEAIEAAAAERKLQGHSKDSSDDEDPDTPELVR